VAATRTHPLISLGASPRGSLNLSHAARAYAAINGRDFVAPDDVKTLAVAVLAHRLLLKPEARIKSITAEDVVEQILGSTPVPC
jgi:MoxR-like ATPase